MGSDTGVVIPRVAEDLTRLGLRRGDVVLVHSSFKSLGLTDHTPADVIRTLVEVIGREGTLIMPTFTYSFGGVWGVQPFRKDSTPGRFNGVLTETLRGTPGALRSGHPTYSVAAIGRQAEQVVRGKEYASAMGFGSSFDEALKLGAQVLLLGVGNNRNSMMHYAEIAAGLPYHDIPFRSFWGDTAVVEQDGAVIERPLSNDYPACSGGFGVADDYLASRGVLRLGKVAAASCMLMDAAAMVGAIVERLRKEPDWLLCKAFVCEPCTLRKRRLRERGLI
jgi:aminoglycoside 3-N-acetyltransferase